MKPREHREVTAEQTARHPDSHRDPIVSVGLGLAQTGILLCLVGGGLVVARQHRADAEPTPPPVVPNFTVAEFVDRAPITIIDCDETPQPSVSTTFDAVLGSEVLLGIGHEPNEARDGYDVTDAYLLKVEEGDISLIPYIGGATLLRRDAADEERLPLLNGELTVDLSTPGMISASLSCD